MLTGIRQLAQDSGARLGMLGDGHGAGKRGTSRDADEDTLLLRELTREIQGCVTGDWHQPIDIVSVYRLTLQSGDEIR